MLIHNSSQAFNTGIICVFSANNTGHFINTVFDAKDQTTVTDFYERRRKVGLGVSRQTIVCTISVTWVYSELAPL